MISPYVAVLVPPPGGRELSESRPTVAGASLLDVLVHAVVSAGAARVLLLQEATGSAGHPDVRVVTPATATEDLASARGGVLVVSADRPLVRADTLQRLVAAHARGTAAVTVLQTLDPQPEEPAAAVITAPLLSKALAQNEGAFPQALAALLDRLVAAGERPRVFETDAGRELRAISTLADATDAVRTLRERRVAELVAGGVVIEDPSSVHVAPSVVVESGAILRPGTILEGRTHVGSGASIGPFARLVHARIGPLAQILDHCFLRECTVEAGATVGPFAHVRPESVIGENAKVGNFVELKKTVLGKGSKAPHLSYLGDAVIGEKVNVGAGTITCNYDGVLKHPTRIESGAFIGSNTTLVAPVTVGAGAYVAAGSAITEDVPADSLALGRSRQTNKEGYARTIRERSAAKKKQGDH